MDRGLGPRPPGGRLHRHHAGERRGRNHHLVPDRAGLPVRRGGVDRDPGRRRRRARERGPLDRPRGRHRRHHDHRPAPARRARRWCRAKLRSPRKDRRPTTPAWWSVWWPSARSSSGRWCCSCGTGARATRQSKAMEPDELIAQLTLEARRVPALEPNALDAPVPWCGEWRVGDVVGHLSGVQRWATVLSNQPGTWIRRREMERAAGRTRGARVVRGRGRPDAGRVRRHRPGDRPSTPGPVSNRGAGGCAGCCTRPPFIAGTPRPAAQVASTPRRSTPRSRSTGSTSCSTTSCPWWPTELAGAGETMHLHATDAPGEWLVRFTDRRCRRRAGARQG